MTAKIDKILKGLEGVVSIADDIVVHSVTEEQLDNNMRNENGLIFNPDK